MNTLRRFKTSFLIASFALFSFAVQAECLGSADVHNGFCKGKSEDACGMAAVCNWEESKTQKIEVTIKNQSAKSCVAQEGKEAHESFCNAHDRAACRVHSSLCIWE